MIREHKDKLAEADIKTLTEAIEAAKKVSGDEKAGKDALETATKDLNDKLLPIGAKMYEQAEGEDTGHDADEEGKNGHTKPGKVKSYTVEGEFVDEKDE